VHWYAYAIYCSGEVNRRSSLVLSFESGFVPAPMRRLTHNVAALSACRLYCTYTTSDSATTVVTVRKAPVIACAPTLCTLFIKALLLHPHAYIKRSRRNPRLLATVAPNNCVVVEGELIAVVLVPLCQRGPWPLHLQYTAYTKVASP
jgi:hypothetical protein